MNRRFLTKPLLKQIGKHVFIFLSSVRLKDQCHFHVCIINMKLQPEAWRLEREVKRTNTHTYTHTKTKKPKKQIKKWNLIWIYHIHANGSRVRLGRQDNNEDSGILLMELILNTLDTAAASEIWTEHLAISQHQSKSKGQLKHWCECDTKSFWANAASQRSSWPRLRRLLRAIKCLPLSKQMGRELSLHFQSLLGHKNCIYRIICIKLFKKCYNILLTLPQNKI